MFFEYALDPAAVTSWEVARYFLDAFGPWKGRFLSQYPKHWRRLLLSGLSCGDVEKKRIEERLRQATNDHVFYHRPDTHYDGTQPWIENARLEHSRQAFRAIIAREASSEDHVLDASTLDETHPRWQAGAGRLVARDATAFAQALDLLLRASSKVMIIDPYFRADQAAKTAPLTAFCRLIKGCIEDVHVHYADEPRGYIQCTKDAERVLPGCVPRGMRVLLHCWKERSGGARLHNRYVLTDVGGVQFGDGIEGGDRGQHDRVSILEESTRARLWEEYAGVTPDFEPVGVLKVFVGTR